MKLHELKQNAHHRDRHARAERKNSKHVPAHYVEQRTEWNKAKSELEALDERIAHEVAAPP